MRLWSTVVSQLQRPVFSPEYSPPYAGDDIAVVAKSSLRLLQCRQIGDDIGDLLIGKSAVRRGDFRLENRIVLVEAERRHDDLGFHLARVLDPEREVGSCVGKTAGRDGAARADVGEVRSGHTHRCRISCDGMAADARRSREDLLSTRRTAGKTRSEHESFGDGRVWNGEIRNFLARKDVAWWQCSR